ncbi:MAG: hypothetical protein IKP81_08505 [Paludibacteraceae bacterium]|nr:hypothetical protein [Paludibacteraceae bacterium]
MEKTFFNLCDRQYDKEFDKNTLLERYPWVGCNFAKSSCRPLILGDSHYATNKDGSTSDEEYKNFKDNKDSTRDVINTVIANKCEGENTWNMFEGLLKTFIDVSPDNVKDFWSKVAFYNFIQEPMKKADEIPSDKHKEDGWRCLAGVIKVLHPTSILIVGVRNDCCSDRINGDDIKLEDFKDDIDEKRNNCAPRIGNIKFGNDIIPLTMIKHTSQGYSYDEWKKYLRIRDSQMMDYLCTYQRK